MARNNRQHTGRHSGQKDAPPENNNSRATTPLIRENVTIKEALGVMGISKATLYRKIYDGRLPKLKARGYTLILMVDLRAWLDAAEVRAA